MYKFIENLNEENLEKFIGLLKKEKLYDLYNLVKNQFGYNSDKELLKDFYNIYNGNLMDGYQGFIFHEDMYKFFANNKKLLLDYLIEYVKSNYSEEDYLSEMVYIISGKLSPEYFIQDLFDDSLDIKENLVIFVVEDIIRRVMDLFDNTFSKEY